MKLPGRSFLEAFPACSNSECYRYHCGSDKTRGAVAARAVISSLVG
ncbi:hypothetical protein EKH55_1472 [Sinorhizobium alkalisoli]|nr:hypothetical protein EKH55_1472 [Sinorhizobium alkalisoli]